MSDHYFPPRAFRSSCYSTLEDKVTTLRVLLLELQLRWLPKMSQVTLSWKPATMNQKPPCNGHSSVGLSHDLKCSKPPLLFLPSVPLPRGSGYRPNHGGLRQQQSRVTRTPSFWPEDWKEEPDEPGGSEIVARRRRKVTSHTCLWTKDLPLSLVRGSDPT